MLSRLVYRRLFCVSCVNLRPVANMERNTESDKKAYLGPQTRSKTKLYSTFTTTSPSECDPQENKNSSSEEQTQGEMSYIVGHDKEKKEFYIVLKGDKPIVGSKAVLQYNWIRPKFVDLYHTGVPPVFRGKGIAKLLAKAATEHFAAEEVTMKPSCTYIQKYVLETRIPRIFDLINWDDID